MDKQEVWKDIPHYEGRYQASSWGRIKSFVRHNNGHILNARKVPKTHTKYRRIDLYVTLCDETGQRSFEVARLVAMTFYGESDKKMTVNHIDGNPLNNKLNNLEWVSLKENIRKYNSEGRNLRAKPISLINKKGEKIMFVSFNEATHYLGRKSNYINAAIARNAKTITNKNGEVYEYEILSKTKEG